MTAAQKLVAIQALIDGEWDNPELVKVGSLFPEIEDNISMIMKLPTTPDTISEGATEIIKDCLSALNEIPRKKLHSEKYKDSYELASAVGRFLKATSN